MLLNLPDVPTLSLSLARWENFEYLSTFFVIVGVVGEYVAEFTRLANTTTIGKKIARVSMIILVGGLAGELLGIVKTSQLSARLINSLELQIASTNSQAAQANERAAEAEQGAEKLRLISQSEAQMWTGSRPGLDALNDVLKHTSDPETLRFVRTALETASKHYESKLRRAADPQYGNSVTGMMWLSENRFRRQDPSPGASTLQMPSCVIRRRDIVNIISTDDDLDAVAFAFHAFRETTGQNVKMFDFDAVRSWCSQNKRKCDGAAIFPWLSWRRAEPPCSRE